VFPGFYHPKEHHLFLVTKTPFVHYFFGSRTLGQAYQHLIDERGARASWYRRDFPGFLSWERSFMINGMTKRRFRRLVGTTGFKIELDYPLALLETGKVRRRHPILRAVVPLFQIAARLPLLEEAFTHRISMVLQRPPSTPANKPDPDDP
jgi:hypothetical protein